MRKLLNPDDVRMSLGDHLEELRKRLILGLTVPILFAIGLMFVAHRWVVPFLCQPLAMALKSVDQSPNLYIPQVGDAFSVYLRVCLMGGLALGVPWLIWQLWLFVAPGLYTHERRFVVLLLPGSTLLALLGLFFMYYVMLPFTLWFLVGFAANFPMPDLEGTWLTDLLQRDPPRQVDGAAGEAPIRLPQLRKDPVQPEEGMIWIKVPENQLRIAMGDKVRKIPLEGTNLVTPQLHLSEYIKFVMWMALSFAVAFQLPLVMLLVAVLGIAGHAQMRKAWRFALLGCFILGAILTPADPFSQFALAVPLYTLYEFGLILARMVERKRRAAE